MATAIKYVGVHTGGIDIPGYDGVAHGGIVEVDDELASALLAITDDGKPQWAPVKPSKTTTTPVEELPS